MTQKSGLYALSHEFQVLAPPFFEEIFGRFEPLGEGFRKKGLSYECDDPGLPSSRTPGFFGIFQPLIIDRFSGNRVLLPVRLFS
jgi:hypothetical protein